MAWAIDDARWVLGNADYLDLLVLAAVGGVLVGFIGPKVGWGRWLTFLIGADLRGAARAARHRAGRALRDGASIGEPLPARPPTSAVAAYIDIAIRDLAVDDPVPALHPDPRAARVGDLDVRVVRRVRPSPAAQRRRRRRGGPGREHGDHGQRPAPLPGPVQHRLAVPAHPLARLRRAIGVAAPPDRRSGQRSRRSTCAAGPRSSRWP